MNKDSVNIAGAILAGGKNSRMGGRDKSFIEIGGTSIIERTIRLFEGIFEEIILATNPSYAYKYYAGRVITIEDEIKDAGPLGGIHAALSKTSKKGVFLWHAICLFCITVWSVASYLISRKKNVTVWCQE